MRGIGPMRIKPLILVKIWYKALVKGLCEDS